MVAKPAATKKASVTKQKRAGLTFPVARMKTRLKQNGVAQRIGGNADIFFAAVVEHVVDRVLEDAQEHASQEVATRVSKDGTKKSTTRRLKINDLVQSVRTDPDLARLFADFSFSTHESAIKPGKVQKVIMTPKDYEKLKKKQEESKAKAIVAAQAAAKKAEKAAKKKKD